MMRTISAAPDLGLAGHAVAVGERALMRAVLEDAIQCLAGEVGPERERAQLAAAARAWIENEDRQWPFAFENLCDALGFDVGALRARVLGDAPPPGLEACAPVEAVGRHPEPGEPEVSRMIRAGQPLRVVAQHFGISVSKASLLSSGLASRMKAARDEDIRALRGTGWAPRALAAHFGLSRVRILRICARRELPAPEREHSAA